MNRVAQAEAILASCTPREKAEILRRLQALLPRHPFETRMNTSAEIILDALERGSDLTLRGIRGVIGEAVFVHEIIPRLKTWRNVTPTGDHAYDAALQDDVGTVRIQIKMQRRAKGQPMLRKGSAIVEVQRTRGGVRDGEQTRPYRFGEFDILAVCVEPSTGDWTSFRYIPERWLIPRVADSTMIDIMQSVAIVPDAVWTDDFETAVARLRSTPSRPTP